jgi:hypothetical protein
MKLLQIQQLGYRVEAWSTALPISRSAINFDADSVRLVMQLSMEGKYISVSNIQGFFSFLKHNSRPNLTSYWHPPSQPHWQTPPIQVGFTWRKKLNLSQDKVQYKARQNQGASGRNAMNHW